MRSAIIARLTRHAQLMIERRRIEVKWIEDTIDAPDTTRQDDRDESLILAFRRVPEADGRWLRVVYRREGPLCVVVTAFFDRNQEKRT